MVSWDTSSSKHYALNFCAWSLDLTLSSDRTWIMNDLYIWMGSRSPALPMFLFHTSACLGSIWPLGCHLLSEWRASKLPTVIFHMAMSLTFCHDNTCCHSNGCRGSLFGSLILRPLEGVSLVKQAGKDMEFVLSFPSFVFSELEYWWIFWDIVQHNSFIRM